MTIDLKDAEQQQFIANLIDEAVDCWHEVADDHDIKHCNCFRAKFAQSLIDQNIFVGYNALEEMWKAVDALAK